MLGVTKILGYVELKVGTLDIEVPIFAPDPDEPPFEAGSLARFEVSGKRYGIVVSSETRSDPMRRAVEEAAEDALKHLSRTLLN